MRVLARSVVMGMLLAGVVPPGVAAQQVLTAIPPELQGSWGADCASPEMTFEAAALLQRGDRAKSPVRQVVRREGEVDIHYERPADKVSVVDTFKLEGASLRLTSSLYGTMRTTWNKRPWQRCGGSQATQVQPAQASQVQAPAQPAQAQPPPASGRRYPVVATIPIGPWTVTSHNDQAATFSHCELTRRDGTLTFGITRGKGGYVLFLANDAWTALKAGVKYDLALEGAGLQPRTIAANSVEGGVIAVLGSDQALINQMKRLQRLDIRTAQTVIAVPMNLADAGLTELETCWTQNSVPATNPFAR